MIENVQVICERLLNISQPSKDHTRNQGKKKPFLCGEGFYNKKRIGGDLLSHQASLAVPSARRGLTSVCGMGTGVTLSL